VARGTRIRNALVDARIQMRPGGGFRVTVRQQFAGRPLRRELEFRDSPEQFAESGAEAFYCPSCRAVRSCDAVAVGQIGSAQPRRFIEEANPDSLWFRHVQMCRSCFYHFVTAEVSETQILEMSDRMERASGAGANERSDSGEILDFSRRDRRAREER